jgi:hypothetical protein
MEEIKEHLLPQIQLPSPTYVAVYDPNTGVVVSVGPSHAFINVAHKIEIDSEIAEQIIEGKLRISSCFVDPRESKLEIAEIKSVYKIDDLLHRIIEKQWADIDCPDIFISYNSKKKLLTFQLTEEFYGTKKLPKEFQPVTKRKVKWSGDTELHFLVTEYNDPNIFYEMLSFKVSNLVGKSKIYKNLELPDKFSIYTRRIFKNYILEIV